MKLREPSIIAEVVKVCPLCTYTLSLVIWQNRRCDENESNPGPYELMCVISDLEMKFARKLTCASQRILKSKVPSGFQDTNA